MSENMRKINDRTTLSLWRTYKRATPLTLALLACAVLAPVSHSDEPFARSRQYDLQNARMEMQFDLDQHKVMGQVTHTLAALSDALTSGKGKPEFTERLPDDGEKTTPATS